MYCIRELFSKTSYNKTSKITNLLLTVLNSKLSAYHVQSALHNMPSLYCALGNLVTSTNTIFLGGIGKFKDSLYSISREIP